MFQPEASLTIDNVAAAVVAGTAAVADGQSVIDLSRLKTVDSSAVVAMLSWQRAAKESGGSLTFANVPHNLHSLAQLYGVDELLGC
ncbi:MAG: anti-anti-sigma factor [Paucimonas sp.]|jgi:phospholipid transport system transporter-binding protein|nr:anti-anti-sigma factor [Paucimonas sp.]